MLMGFHTKLFSKDKRDHCILIKGTIHQDDVIIVYIFAPNLDASRFIKTNAKSHKRPVFLTQ